MDRQHIGGIDFDVVSFSESFSTSHASYSEPEESGKGDQASLLSEFLYSMHDDPDKVTDIIRLLNSIALLYSNSSLGFNVTVAKVLNPGLSYQDIAEKYGTSKQLVSYHLDRSKKLIPTLESAILVDHRHQPKLNHAKSLTKVAKSGRKRRLRNKLRQHIEQNYSSLLDFSKKMNISYDVVRRTANNLRKPSMETRRNFARAFGITLEQLKERFDI
jgi:ribosome-binding protein aMBF1 (putative translation factor)